MDKPVAEEEVEASPLPLKRVPSRLCRERFLRILTDKLESLVLDVDLPLEASISRECLSFEDKDAGKGDENLDLCSSFACVESKEKGFGVRIINILVIIELK